MRQQQLQSHRSPSAISLRFFISPQQPGPGGRCVCQSAVTAQGGGTLARVNVFRFPTYGFPLRGALMRSG